VLTTVEVDEVDEFEAIEEEELDRCRGLRGANMPRISSGSIALRLCPPLVPHDGLFKSEKLGGFATAVMGKSVAIDEC
jgi:hypothetical protein